MAKKVYTQEEQVERIKKILSVEKGTKAVMSTGNRAFPLDAIFQVASTLAENDLLIDCTSKINPETGAKEPIDYGDGQTIMLCACDEKFRLVVLPPREDLFKTDEICEYANALLMAAALRNARNAAVPNARMQNPISAVLPKLSELPYNRLAPAMIKALYAQPSHAYRLLDSKTLKECLASEVAAKSLAPLVPDENFDAMLQVLIAKSEEVGMSSLLFRSWLQSRHVVQAELSDEMAGVIDVGELTAATDEVIAKREAAKAKAATKAVTGASVPVQGTDATGRSI